MYKLNEQGLYLLLQSLFTENLLFGMFIMFLFQINVVF